MCILCQQTSPKCWCGNRTITSFCDVTNSAHQIQMTTLCRWMNPPPWKVSAYATASWNAKSCNICHSKYCRKKATLTAIFHVLITTSRIFTRLNFFRLFHLHWSHLHSKAADRVLHDPNVRSFYSDCHTFLGRFLDKHGRGACPNSTGNNHCLDYDDTKFRSKSVAA